AVEMFAAGCRDSKCAENFWLGRSRSVEAMRRWFLEHKDVRDWGDDDGRSAAEDFMLMWKGGSARKGVDRLLLEVKGIRQACERNVWFRPLLEAVIENNLKLGSDCFLGVLELGADDGAAIGVSLASALATTLTAEAAVDEWVCRFPALGEFEKENAWFRSFFNVVARSLFYRAIWGLKMRMAVGCVLSVVDVGSDIWMIFKYMEMEEMEKSGHDDGGGEWEEGGFGPSFFLWATIYCIALSMFHQVVVVITQNRKQPLILLREVIIVLLGIKPVFDAYRVAQNATKEGEGLDVMGEMVITRSIECIIESIPSSILQTVAFFKSGGKAKSALFTAFISSVTTGFTMSSIAYDFDTSPTKRKENSYFYGYIPDNANDRMIAFFCLFVACTTHCGWRIFSSSLLIMVDWRYFTTLFLAYRFYVGDFQYWIPVGGPLGFLFSLMKRIADKFVTDFTLLLHLRHPYEMGGRWWSYIAVSTPVWCWICTFVYFRARGGGGEVDGITKEAALSTLVFFTLLWLVSFGTFFRYINPKYIHTFYSSQTSKECLCNIFIHAKTDEQRFVVFKKHKSYRKAVEADIKLWVQRGWDRWVIDSPAWFVRSKIPLDMVPVGRVERRGGLLGPRQVLGLEGGREGDEGGGEGGERGSSGSGSSTLSSRQSLDEGEDQWRKFLEQWNRSIKREEKSGGGGG
ncbi:hypothetical protein TrRE_jg138, partial [Triparma retinervis]